METIPITSLTPEDAPPANKTIRGIVTLSWPYSSSTRQCALLLADPDFRLRNRKGQVRVRFTGASAEAVARSRVGIGDEVVLALDGALWEQDAEASRTPGKSVDGELMFKRRLRLTIVRSEGDAEINVDAPASPPRSMENPREIATPLPRAVTSLHSSLDGALDSLPSYTYTSPAFVKRLQESLLDSAYDPFVGDDVDTEVQDQTNWSTYSSKLKWRYSEKTPSPKKEKTARVVEDADEAQGSLEAMSESPPRQIPSPSKMLPPPRPPLQMPNDQAAAATSGVEQVEGPSTSKMRPVGSPTLPLPSPFPTDTRPLQYDLFDDAASPEDRIQKQTRLTEDQAEVSEAINQTVDQDADVEMLDQGMENYDTIAQDYTSDTEPDDEQVEQALLERHGVSAEVDPVQPPHEPKAVDEIHETRGEVRVADRNHEQSLQRPQTPEMATDHALPLGFGLDGASSAPASTHVTPQSEKDKIMAQTYRSLFGFQRSPDIAAQVTAEQEQPASPTPTRNSLDMTNHGLMSADVVMEEPQHLIVEVPVEEAGKDPEEASPDEMLPPVSPPKQQPQPPPSSLRPSQPEVIELGSSSDEEEEEDALDRAPVRPVPRRRVPKLEIQDSLADREAKDLLSARSEASSRITGSGTTGAQVSRLQHMVNEDTADQPRRVVQLEDVAHYPPVGPKEPRHVETGFGDSFGDLEKAPGARAQQEHLVSSPLSSVPMGFTQLLSSPVTELMEQGINPPDEKPDATTSLDATSKAVHEESTRDIVQPSSTAQTTVIELISSSPAESPRMSSTKELDVGGKVTQAVPQTDDAISLPSPTINETMESETTGEPKVTTSGLAQTSSLASLPDDSEAQDIRLQQHMMETPLYPSLPLSPSNSQSLQDMPFQQPTETSLPETLTSVLPPTPQLTQHESSTHFPVAVDASSFDSQLEEIQQPIELPQAMDEGRTPKTLEKTPARKSLSARLSNVPDVISAWFSPKRSSGVVADDAEEERVKPDARDDAVAQEVEMQQVNGHSLTQKDSLEVDRSDSTGFSTSLSYFTPLARLEELLNPSSQQSHGTNTIDVFAVVTDRTKEPLRAKAGPRDYYTIFKVCDHSLSAHDSVRVEIYRPWLATLPVAGVGDVILLRAFTVKSRKRQAYLLSTDASAWCVWRYGDPATNDANDDGRPIWARKRSNSLGAVREECKGPPVEFDDEEREHATRMREWWRNLQPSNDRDDETPETREDYVLRSPVAQAVAAKL